MKNFGNIQFSLIIPDNAHKLNHTVYLINYLNANHYLGSNLLDIRNLSGTTNERFDIFLSKM